jgi:hypothetical protein
MQAISPVMPGSEPLEVLLKDEQEQSPPLPVVYLERPFRPMITRWRFTAEERAMVAQGADLVLQQITFRQPFQPLDLQVVPPGAMPTLLEG